MKIQCTGRHISVTEALKNYAEEKVGTLSKYNQKIMKVHVLFEVQHNIHHKCEMNLEGKHLSLSAHADTKNMYESISKTVDKLASQLKSHKYSYSDKNHRKSTKMFEHDVLENEATEEMDSEEAILTE